MGISPQVLKNQIQDAFRAAVPDSNRYAVVYAYNIQEKNYIVYRSTVVHSYAVGYSRQSKEIVILPISEERDAIRAGQAIYTSPQNREPLKKDLQQRWVVKTNDAGKFRLTVLPKIPKIMSGAYVLPVEQKVEADDFNDFAKSLKG